MTELEVAMEAARAAAAVLERTRGPRTVETKAYAIELVTEVDRACEDAIRAVLVRHTPEIPILGEEGGGERGGGPRWIVDPIDGTTNFVHRFPFYAVSVALQVDGRTTVGAVIEPWRKREVVAERGRGVRQRALRSLGPPGRGEARRGAPMRVSEVSQLGQALAGTGFPYDRQQRAAFYVKYVEAALRQVQGVRRAGSACLDLTMVSEGCLDLYWEFNVSIWDIAAAMLFVEEAGGVVTAHDGSPIDLERPCPLATNGHLHEAIIALLASVG